MEIQTIREFIFNVDDIHPIDIGASNVPFIELFNAKMKIMHTHFLFMDK